MASLNCKKCGTIHPVCEQCDAATDYIELSPNDVIREGDECQRIDNKMSSLEGWWKMFYGQNGRKISDFPKFRFRRPRSTLIREQRDELLAACKALLASDKECYRIQAREAIRKARPETDHIADAGKMADEGRQPTAWRELS
jgi:hypothetical protein